MSLSRLLRALARRELSTTEIARALTALRERLDPKLNAFCQIDPERFVREAEHAGACRESMDAVGPLHGIPIAVKDDLALAGWPMRQGSHASSAEPVVADEQSPTVTSLLRAGAIVAGKTTLPEFGWKATTQSPLTGVTRNPWNPALTPGGSSGGNAVALATGMVPAAVGTDIGGSVRIPAAFCGVVGFKPTQSVMSGNAEAKTGLLLHSGPMARTVEDIARLMTVLGSEDPERPIKTGATKDYVDQISHPIADLSIGISPGLGFATLDPVITERLEQAAEVFRRLGARVERFDALRESPVDTYETLYTPQLTEEVAGVPESQRDQLDPDLRAMARLGADISAHRFVRALKQRRRLVERMAMVHERYDVVVSATVPILPFAADRNQPEGYPQGRWWRWTPLTLTFNITGQPAISLPCGTGPAGLPIGMQLTGPHNRDDLVLRVAHAYQRAGHLHGISGALD